MIFDTKHTTEIKEEKEYIFRNWKKAMKAAFNDMAKEGIYNYEHIEVMNEIDNIIYLH